MSPNVKSKTTKSWWWILVRFLTDWVYLEPMWSLKVPILAGSEASLVAQKVKNLPAIQETRVWSLGQEDPLEKGKTTHSSILAWRIPWADPGRSQSMESQRVGHDWATHTLTHTYTHRSQQAAGRNLFLALDPARVGRKAQFSTKFSALSWWCPATSEVNCFQGSLAPSLTSRCRLSRPALTTPWLLISWSFFLFFLACEIFVPSHPLPPKTW